MDADEAFFSRIGVNLRDLRASLDSIAACIRGQIPLPLPDFSL
jgi:hypothetical protein